MIGCLPMASELWCAACESIESPHWGHSGRYLWGFILFVRFKKFSKKQFGFAPGSTTLIFSHLVCSFPRLRFRAEPVVCRNELSITIGGHALLQVPPTLIPHLDIADRWNILFGLRCSSSSVAGGLWDVAARVIPVKQKC